MPKDTTVVSGGKPGKPHPDFPLFAHQTGRWAKKVRGKLHYFGPWRDPDAALAKWLAEKDYLLAGRKPPANLNGPTVRDLANRFLTFKQNAQVSGELSQRTFEDYHRVCERMLEAFGRDRRLDDVGPDDFEALRTSLGKTLGAVALAAEIQRCRVVCKYAYDIGLIERPVRYGQSFNRPSQKTLRKERNSKGPRMFEADQLRAMIDAARPQLRAMILLGVNAGFGNNDCGTLPVKALDLLGGWVNYPRPKTGVARRCPLWPETVMALNEVMSTRKDPKDADDRHLVFITKRRMSWAKPGQDNPICKETVKLLKALGLHRPGLGFYALRHTFATIASESRDQIAVDHVMGHSDRSMSAVYRERISDERLRAVTDHVNAWLFGKSTKHAK
ncbi:MAG: tyrosine-type recombinase/integrase [Planctomycetia bacterium]|nr:tyrosine-type recombinase/integrase [Planctomycetia bacterium]